MDLADAGREATLRGQTQAFPEQAAAGQGLPLGPLETAAGEQGIDRPFEKGQAIRALPLPALRTGAAGDQQSEALLLLMAPISILPVDLAEFEEGEVGPLVVAVAGQGLESLHQKGLPHGVEFRAEGVQQGHCPVGVEGDILGHGEVGGGHEGVVHRLVEAPGDEDAGEFLPQGFGIR